MHYARKQYIVKYHNIQLNNTAQTDVCCKPTNISSIEGYQRQPNNKRKETVKPVFNKKIKTVNPQRSRSPRVIPTPPSGYQQILTCDCFLCIISTMLAFSLHSKSMLLLPINCAWSSKENSQEHIDNKKCPTLHNFGSSFLVVFRISFYLFTQTCDWRRMTAGKLESFV